MEVPRGCLAWGLTVGCEAMAGRLELAPRGGGLADGGDTVSL